MPVTGGDIDDLIHTELLVLYTIGDDKYIYEVAGEKIKYMIVLFILNCVYFIRLVMIIISMR